MRGRGIPSASRCRAAGRSRHVAGRERAHRRAQVAQQELRHGLRRLDARPGVSLRQAARDLEVQARAPSDGGRAGRGPPGRCARARQSRDVRASSSRVASSSAFAAARRLARGGLFGEEPGCLRQRSAERAGTRKSARRAQCQSQWSHTTARSAALWRAIHAKAARRLTRPPSRSATRTSSAPSRPKQGGSATSARTAAACPKRSSRAPGRSDCEAAARGRESERHGEEEPGARPGEEGSRFPAPRQLEEDHGQADRGPHRKAADAQKPTVIVAERHGRRDRV